MAGEIENFGKKRNTNGFDKNPQNISGGRPRKGISAVIDELKEKGYEPALKQDVEATYMSLVQLKEDELKELINDKDKPMLVRITAKKLLSEKGFEIAEKMLDRGIGKPIQANETNIKGDLNIGNIIIQ